MELLEQRLEDAVRAARAERSGPRRRFVSTPGEGGEFAAYVRDWSAKIERTANVDHAADIHDAGLIGSVVLTVVVRADGSVERVDVLQSSNVPELDAAATRVVRLAEPFAPLPRTEPPTEHLYITRTWEFVAGDTVRMR